VVAPGWVNNDLFLSGYGAAQAVPGPLFSFAAYLGAVSSFGLHGVWGAALCLIAIFLPGNLVLIGTLPFWSALQARPGTQSAVRGVNASVVGILATALYSPIWTSSIRNPYDLVIALVGFVLLVAWKAPPLLVVAMCGIAGMLLSQYGQIV
jgi:chromate transporter